MRAKFVVLPIRICASYLVMYLFIPRFLLRNETIKFVLIYGLVIILAGLLQRLFIYFFHELFFSNEIQSIFYFRSVLKAMILINTTVIFLSSIKMFQYWKVEQGKNKKVKELVKIKADKRIFRIDPSDIIYVEGLGNYVVFYLKDKKKLISYNSLKEAQKLFPEKLIRIHKSFVVNKDWILSYNSENVEVVDKILPIGKNVKLEL